MRGSGPPRSSRCVSAQTRASRRSGEAPEERPSGAEVAQLVLERRQGADMAHAALRVEHRDRLGPQVLAARRPHRRHRHGGSTCAQDGAGHLAALVDLDHEAVGRQAVVERQRRRGPGLGRGPGQGRVGQHVGVARAVEAGRDDPAGIRPGLRARPAGRPPRRCGAGLRRRRRRGPASSAVARPEGVGAGPRSARRRVPGARAGCRHSARPPRRGRPARGSPRCRRCAPG